MSKTTTVVIGGTSGIGKEVAAHFAATGGRVFLSGRDADRSQRVAAEIGGDSHGLALDLAEPRTIIDALEGIDSVDHLVVAAIERDANTVRSFDIAKALRLVTLKLVGYAEVVHALIARLTPQASIVLFGGVAFERPYPGSTTVSAVNGGVTGLVRTLATELAPTRVNAVHPGIIGDSPAIKSGWTDQARDAVIARTPLGRLVTMQEVVSGVLFLLDNTAVNGTNLVIDGGCLLE